MGFHLAAVEGSPDLLEPLISSRWNQFRDRVCAAYGQAGDVRVEIGRGERLTSIIRREFYEAMGLNLDREVAGSFKAQAAEVL